MVPPAPLEVKRLFVYDRTVPFTPVPFNATLLFDILSTPPPAVYRPVPLVLTVVPSTSASELAPSTSIPNELFETAERVMIAFAALMMAMPPLWKMRTLSITTFNRTEPDAGPMKMPAAPVFLTVVLMICKLPPFARVSEIPETVDQAIFDEDLAVRRIGRTENANTDKSVSNPLKFRLRMRTDLRTSPAEKESNWMVIPLVPATSTDA